MRACLVSVITMFLPTDCPVTSLGAFVIRKTRPRDVPSLCLNSRQIRLTPLVEIRHEKKIRKLCIFVSWRRHFVRTNIFISVKNLVAANYITIIQNMYNSPIVNTSRRPIHSCSEFAPQGMVSKCGLVPLAQQIHIRVYSLIDSSLSLFRQRSVFDSQCTLHPRVSTACYDHLSVALFCVNNILNL